ncbi:MAG TPA: glycine cleavage system aminomethyltransferase GcvT [Actinotalea sp.]|nr:glycine cleavage system aminomethyltransferase GcvT [Actinotalea sp.]
MSQPGPDQPPLDEPRRGPLHDEHRALGAAMTPFAGWSMPLRYTSDLAEHHAVRTAAGLFDLSHMGEIRVRGAGAAGALDAALVGDLTALAVGRARYTMICQEDGGVLDDLVVYRTGESDYLVVANASNVDVVLGALRDRCAGRGVEVLDESGATALVAVQGPAAVGILAPLVLPDDRAAVVGLRYYAGTTARLDLPGRDGGPGQVLQAWVARTGYTGEDGFELYVPAAQAPALWSGLLEAGRPAGLVPAGLACRDSLRLEAGMPLYGNELDRTTTPYDAGLGRVVRLGKVGADGAPVPFVGRDALAARAVSPPSRVLVGLAGQGRRAARHGYPVLTAAHDGVVVGHVTSGAPSPTLGVPVAMAYVTPEVALEGTELVVDVRGRPEPVHVVPLPFYRRP